MVVTSNLALTETFPIFQHILPTPAHPAVMGPGIFWGANSLAIDFQSTKGPDGTLGAYTHKLSVLVSPSASSLNDSRSFLALAHNAFLVYRNPDYVRCM